MIIFDFVFLMQIIFFSCILIPFIDVLSELFISLFNLFISLMKSAFTTTSCAMKFVDRCTTAFAFICW